MTDDALMTAACDLPLCVPGLYVTVAASDNKGKVASIGFWTNWHTDSGTLTQRCIVCFSHRAHVQRDREGVTIFLGGGNVSWPDWGMFQSHWLRWQSVEVRYLLCFFFYLLDSALILICSDEIMQPARICLDWEYQGTNDYIFLTTLWRQWTDLWTQSCTISLSVDQGVCSSPDLEGNTWLLFWWWLIQRRTKPKR